MHIYKGFLTLNLQLYTSLIYNLCVIFYILSFYIEYKVNLNICKYRVTNKELRRHEAL